jgi:hypothetical protein
MKDQRKVLCCILLVICVVIVLLSRGAAGQEQPPSTTGRYQVATSYRDAGNWVFVTVIDTATGRIVTRERYQGFQQYTEVR